MLEEEEIEKGGWRRRAPRGKREKERGTAEREREKERERERERKREKTHRRRLLSFFARECKFNCHSSSSSSDHAAMILKTPSGHAKHPGVSI